MTTSRTPRYAVRYDAVVVLGEGPVHLTGHGWNCKRSGRPTAANLRKYLLDFEASTLPGEVNEQLGITRVVRAKIVLNDGSQRVVAEYDPPLFEVVS